MRSTTLLLVAIILSGQIYAQHNTPQMPEYSSLEIKEELEALSAQWDSLFHLGQYEKGDSIIWAVRYSYKKETDYFKLSSHILGKYMEYDSNPKSWKLHRKLIDYYGIDNTIGKGLYYSLAFEKFQNHQLLEVEELIFAEIDNYPRFHSLAGLLYKRMGNAEKSIFHAEKSLLRYPKKNMDYYSDLGNLGMSYLQVDSTRAKELIRETYDYYNSKNEANFEFYYHTPLLSQATLLIKDKNCGEAKPILDKTFNAIQNDIYDKKKNMEHYHRIMASYYGCLGNIDKALKELELASNQYDTPINKLLDQYAIRLQVLSKSNEIKLYESSVNETIEILRKMFVTIAGRLTDKELINYYQLYQQDRYQLSKILYNNNLSQKTQAELLQVDLFLKSLLFNKTKEVKDVAKPINISNLSLQEIDSINRVGTIEIDLDELWQICDPSTIKNTMTEKELFLNISSYKQNKIDNYGLAIISSGAPIMTSNHKSINSLLNKLKTLLSDSTFSIINIFPDGELQQFDYHQLLADNISGSHKKFRTVFKIAVKTNDFKLGRATLMGKSQFSPDSTKNGYRGVEFSNLPFVVKEINALEQKLNQYNCHTTIYLDQDIEPLLSENSVLRTSNILHISSHGTTLQNFKPISKNYFDLENYLRHINSTGVILDYKDSTRVVTSKDIIGKELDEVNLCVISSCYSGSGYSSLNFGVFGIARSFLKSGVDHLLLATGEVSDNLSAEFMENFYDKLLTDQLSINQSFNEAKQIQSSKYPNHKNNSFVMMEPFYVNRDNLSSQSSNNFLYWLAGLGVVLFGAIYLIKRNLKFEFRSNLDE